MCLQLRPKGTHSNEISVINYTVRWLDEQWAKPETDIFVWYSNADMCICSLLRRLTILFIDLLPIDHCNVCLCACTQYLKCPSSLNDEANVGGRNLNRLFWNNAINILSELQWLVSSQHHDKSMWLISSMSYAIHHRDNARKL